MSYSRMGRGKHFYAFIGRKDGKMECAYTENTSYGERCMLLTPKQALELKIICEKYLRDVKEYNWKIPERRKYT